MWSYVSWRVIFCLNVKNTLNMKGGVEKSAFAGRKTWGKQLQIPSCPWLPLVVGAVYLSPTHPSRPLPTCSRPPNSPTLPCSRSRGLQAYPSHVRARRFMHCKILSVAPLSTIKSHVWPVFAPRAVEFVLCMHRWHLHARRRANEVVEEKEKTREVGGGSPPVATLFEFCHSLLLPPPPRVALLSVCAPVADDAPSPFSRQSIHPLPSGCFLPSPLPTPGYHSGWGTGWLLCSHSR